MRILYLDCFSGISGDMAVGALADLGVAPSAFEWELAKLDLGDSHLHFERQIRGGISGVKFDVHSGATHDFAQDPAHGTQVRETDHAPSLPGNNGDPDEHQHHEHHHHEDHHHEHHHEHE